MGCLRQVTSLRPMQLQKNESYVYNLHINWDQFSYVTCLDTFIDLKPRISEEWGSGLMDFAKIEKRLILP